MNKGVFISLLLSILAHALIAVVLAHCMDHASVHDKPAQLDVTSVVLSCAETPDETAAATSAFSAMPKAEAPKPSGTKDEPPFPCAIVRVLPCGTPPDTTELPKPDEPMEQFEERAAPRQARIDAPPKPRCAIKPDYPRESRLRGEQGAVTLEIDVAAEGLVEDVRVVVSTGFELLDEAAVKAIRSARFTPAKSGGKPIVSTVRLTLEFKLR